MSASTRGRELAELAEMERDCALQFQQTKDPRFMTERRLIKKRRAEMLGLDAPVQLAGAGRRPHPGAGRTRRSCAVSPLKN